MPLERVTEIISHLLFQNESDIHDKREREKEKEKERIKWKIKRKYIKINKKKLKRKEKAWRWRELIFIIFDKLILGRKRYLILKYHISMLLEFWCIWHNTQNWICFHAKFIDTI